MAILQSIPTRSVGCVHCGKEFLAREKKAKFCNKRCQNAFNKAARGITNYSLVPLTRATTGAMTELLVASDLMRRGFDVFRALSPSCQCDLVIAVAHRLYRIEVRCGARNVSGKLSYSWGKDDEGRSDIVAIAVLHDGHIEYRPDLPSVDSPEAGEASVSDSVSTVSERKA